MDIINLKSIMSRPNDNPDKFIPWLQSSLMKGKKNIELTSGIQLRDFIYIDDVITAFQYILSNLFLEEKVKPKNLKNLRSITFARV